MNLFGKTGTNHLASKLEVESLKVESFKVWHFKKYLILTVNFTFVLIIHNLQFTIHNLQFTIYNSKHEHYTRIPSI